MNLENKIITIKRLAEICACYDQHGDNDFPEHEFEGKTFFAVCFEDMTGETISDKELQKLFPYAYY